MLVHVGSDRSVRIDLRLAVTLAGIAGAINAAAFRTLGFFSANMTGNVSALSEHVAAGDSYVALGFLGLVLSFVSGSFASTLLIEAGRRRGIAGIFAYSIILEGGLLLVLAALEVLFQPRHSEILMLSGLSFLMGLQNAATTRISNARVRTTHVSGIVTDIGVELAVMFAGVRNRDDYGIVRDRLVLHVATIAAFVLGGIAGVLVYGAIGYALFIVLAALLFAIAIPEARKASTARAVDAELR